MDNLTSSKRMVIPSSSSLISGLMPLQGPNAPFVRLIEQPAPRALRFRYECEGRSAGSIPGANSSTQTKTHPTIQVVNYVGAAVVVVSCVTRDGPPYKSHPHNLVGREGCKKGVCTMVINSPDMMCSFTSLGIQCVKKKDIDESLKLREAIKVDPYKCGFAHRTQTSNIDLNVVRLCFQVFLQGGDRDKYNIPLPPIVSEPIFDKKALCELVITKLSHHSAPVSGGQEVILLCDRVTKDDVQVYFYQEHRNQVVWEDQGDFQPVDVHKQFAICFRTPRYANQNITQPVNVYVQLRRISDGNVSEPRPFLLTPLGDPEGLRHKRQKIDEGCLDRYLREEMPIINALTSADGNRAHRIIKHPKPRIKTEPGFAQNCQSLDPSDLNLQHLQGHPGNMQAPISNQQHIPRGPGSIGATNPTEHSHPSSVKHLQKNIQSVMLGSTTTSNSKLSGINNSNDAAGPSEKMETSMQETLEKFDSLDIGIDYKELNELMGSNLDENLTFNLSASLFDSGNLNNMNSAPAFAASNSVEIVGVPTNSTEENLQQISRLHTEISALNNLCDPSKEN